MDMIYLAIASLVASVHLIVVSRVRLARGTSYTVPYSCKVMTKCMYARLSHSISVCILESLVVFFFMKILDHSRKRISCQVPFSCLHKERWSTFCRAFSPRVYLKVMRNLASFPGTSLKKSQAWERGYEKLRRDWEQG